MSAEDIMEITGVENSKLFVTSDEIFTNSSCVFFEYFDLVEAPWFSFFKYISRSDIMSSIFFLDEFKDMNIDELFAWYVNRQHKNFLLDLHYNKDTLILAGVKHPEEFYRWCDTILEKEMCECEFFFNENLFLNFKSILENMINSRLIIKKFICYNEYYSPLIDNKLKNISDCIEFRYGKIEDILKSIPDDTTYIFSDVNKMNSLLDMNKLDLSSIILTDHFAYNFIEGKSLRLDNEKFKNHTYKLDLFNNLTI